MNSMWKLTLGAAGLVAATAFVTTQVVAQQKKDDKPAAAPAGMDAEMMMKMMALAAPGKEHKELAAMAGEWDSTMRFKMDPTAAEWTEGKATSKWHAILGGR